MGNYVHPKGEFVIAMNYNLDSIRPELDALTKTIVATVPTEQIYLFGSYAYGTPTKDSDLDLYVVLKDSAPMRDVDAMSEIDGATFKQRFLPMDILAFKRKTFEYRKDGLSTIERAVSDKGIKLYDRGVFYG
jgi:predicted nucleotidyltransferase